MSEECVKKGKDRHPKLKVIVDKGRKGGDICLFSTLVPKVL